MIESFEVSREELDRLRSQVSEKISTLEQAKKDNWQDIINTVKSLFSEIQLNVEDFMNSMEALEAMEQDEAKKYFQNLNTDLQNFETRFNELQLRGPIEGDRSDAENQHETPDIVPYQMPLDVQPTQQHLDRSHDISEPLNPLEADIETNDEQDRGICFHKRKMILVGLMIFFMIIAAFCFIYFAIL